MDSSLKRYLVLPIILTLGLWLFPGSAGSGSRNPRAGGDSTATFYVA